MAKQIKLRTLGEVNAFNVGRATGRNDCVDWVIKTVLLALYEEAEWTPENLQSLSVLLSDAVDSWVENPEETKEHYKRMEEETGISFSFSK